MYNYVLLESEIIPLIMNSTYKRENPVDKLVQTVLK